MSHLLSERQILEAELLERHKSYLSLLEPFRLKNIQPHIGVTNFIFKDGKAVEESYSKLDSKTRKRLIRTFQPMKDI